MEAFAMRVVREDGSLFYTLTVDGKTVRDFPGRKELEAFARENKITFRWLSGDWHEK